MPVRVLADVVLVALQVDGEQGVKVDVGKRGTRLPRRDRRRRRRRRALRALALLELAQPPLVMRDGERLLPRDEPAAALRQRAVHLVAHRRLV